MSQIIGVYDYVSTDYLYLSVKPLRLSCLLLGHKEASVSSFSRFGHRNYEFSDLKMLINSAHALKQCPWLPRIERPRVSGAHFECGTK
jgi:hypothetical protein